MAGRRRHANRRLRTAAGFRTRCADDCCEEVDIASCTSLATCLRVDGGFAEVDVEIDISGYVDEVCPNCELINTTFIISGPIEFVNNSLFCGLSVGATELYSVAEFDCAGKNVAITFGVVMTKHFITGEITGYAISVGVLVGGFFQAIYQVAGKGNANTLCNSREIDIPLTRMDVDDNSCDAVASSVTIRLIDL